MPSYFPENNAALANDSLERSMAKVVGGLPPALDFMFGSFYRNFADKKTLNHGIGPAITFTRSSDATFFDANGTLKIEGTNVPRFDHDSLTGGLRGLLIEESRTNLLQQSENLSNSPWVSNVGYTVLPNTHTAPDGNQTADSIVVDLGTSSFITNVTRQTVSKAATAITYTRSIFAKAIGSATSVRLIDFGANTNVGSNVVVSLINGSVISGLNNAGFTNSSVSVSNVGNGWFRIALTYTTDNHTSLTVRNFPYVGNSPLIGDGVSGIYVWGAQLEQGAFPTSYIPTTTAAATRAADSAVVTPISSFYNQAESTLFSESSAISVAADTTVAAINNTTQNEQIDHRYAITGLNTRVRVGGVNQAAFTSGSAPVSGIVYKLAGAYKQNDFAFSVNGSTASTDSLGDMPTGLSQMDIGRRAGSGIITGHIRKIAYWPKRLSNELLQQLTT
jgi:hypothetical protein